MSNTGTSKSDRWRERNPSDMEGYYDRDHPKMPGLLKEWAEKDVHDPIRWGKYLRTGKQ